MHGACDIAQRAMMTPIVTCTRAAQLLCCVVLCASPHHQSTNKRSFPILEAGLSYLLLIMVVYSSAILRSLVVTLAICLQRIMSLEEDSQKDLVACLGWIIKDLISSVPTRYTYRTEQGTLVLLKVPPTIDSMARVTMLHYVRTPSGHDNSKN